MPPTSFNSPRLIRLLADLVVEDAANSNQSKQSFAERLGQWLDLNDAIALSGALAACAVSGGRVTNAADARAPSPSPAAGTASGDFARVRATLAEAIASDGVSRAGKVRIKLPAPAVGAAETAADFQPYRRYYLAHQRDMEAAIGPLRSGLRAALAKRSPALAQLAALDAVMEKALGERERNLLAGVPDLLEQRFEHLRTAHAQALAATPQPGGWLAAFGRDMQAVLLAELEVRLQPVAGLIEASGSPPC